MVILGSKQLSIPLKKQARVCVLLRTEKPSGDRAKFDSAHAAFRRLNSR